MAEDSRNQIRGLRRTARKDLDEIKKDGGVSSDDITRAADKVDVIARKYETQVDEAQKRKEQELLDV